MPHPFTVREIARQAGLSEATVDRVLHDRGGVRESTAADVHRAVEELRRQRSQVRTNRRALLVDLVVEAPERFSGAVRDALEAALPSLQPTVLRARHHLRERWPVAGLVETLDRIAARGSHGVLLKAPDVPEVAAAVRRVVAAGTPVVTLVTDVAASGRAAYVGIDNRAAGATAAYLVARWLGERPGSVLVTLSLGAFRGEEEREMGFRATLRALSPGRAVVEVSGSHGLDVTARHLVGAALDRDPGVAAVYSVGGGNTATLEAFADRGLPDPVLVAHDLDADNLRLLAAGRVAAVLHHDLRSDLVRACQALLRARGVLPGPPVVLPSPVQVVTPYNVPADALGPPPG